MKCWCIFSATIVYIDTLLQSRQNYADCESSWRTLRPCDWSWNMTWNTHTLQTTRKQKLSVSWLKSCRNQRRSATELVFHYIITLERIRWIISNGGGALPVSLTVKCTGKLVIAYQRGPVRKTSNSQLTVETEPLNLCLVADTIWCCSFLRTVYCFENNGNAFLFVGLHYSELWNLA